MRLHCTLILSVTQDLEERARIMKMKMLKNSSGTPTSDTESYRSRRDHHVDDYRDRHRGVSRDRGEMMYDRDRDFDRPRHRNRHRNAGMEYSIC